MKDEVYWCAFRDGRPEAFTIRWLRRDTIKAVELLPEWPWERIKKHGWTVEKVTIQKYNP